MPPIGWASEGSAGPPDLAAIIGRSPRTTHWSFPLDEPQPNAPRPHSEPATVPPPSEPAAEPDARAAAAAPAGAPAGDTSPGDAPFGDAPASEAPSPGTTAPPEDPPSLRGQIGSTKDAVKSLVSAHVELGKAEIGEVLDEVKKLAALGGIAIAVAIAAGLLLSVGLPLFLGEWLFGSMGWGLLHGLLFLAAIAVAALVAGLGVSTTAIGRALVVGVISGLAVAVILWLNLTHRAWTIAGDSLLPLADAGSRPLAAAIVVLPVVLGVLFGLLMLAVGLRGGSSSRDGSGVGARIGLGLAMALFVGWLAAFAYSYGSRVAWPDLTLVGVGVGGFVVTLVVCAIVGIWRPAVSMIGGMSLGVVTGLVFGGLTAIEFGSRVAAALGVTTALLIWISMMAAEVMRLQFDGDAFMKRFIPQQTIDMTKETFEWARERMPLSRRS